MPAKRKRKLTHGGRRKGAGRPRGAPTTQLTVRVPTYLLPVLDAALAPEQSRQQWIGALATVELLRRAALDRREPGR